MNFFKLNNNIEPKRMLIESGHQDKMKLDTPAMPIAVFRNCRMNKVQCDYNFEDEYSIVERFDEDEKDNVKGKMWSDIKVVVEKLPDSVVQQYVAKKPKNYETMNFGQKLSKSSKQHYVKKENNYKVENRTSNSVLKQYLAKKQSLETDKFIKELCNPTMQQYLAKTEMGYFNHFTEQIPEPQVKVNDCTTDSLIENLSDTDMIRYPVQMERDDETSNGLQQYSVKKEKDYKIENLTKSLSYSTVQQANVDLYCNDQQLYIDVEKIDYFTKNHASFAEQQNSTMKRNIRRMKSGCNRERSKKNIRTNQYQRICPNCNKYTQQAHKASSKVKCHECNVFTQYECKKCRQQAPSYRTFLNHLLYDCEAHKVKQCAHCKYSVRAKRALSLHIKRNHVKIISRNLMSQNRGKHTGNVSNKQHEGPGHNQRYENLIVLKKQKEMKSKSEWYIENVKRSYSKVDDSIGLSVPSKSTSTLPVPHSTDIKKMSQLYCKCCDKIIIGDDSYTKSGSEIYCRLCGTDLLFKCLKCHSTFESHHSMKHHLKKDCDFKENKRKSFHCSKCNYRSFFEGLVINHRDVIHSIETLQEFCPDNLNQNFCHNDSDFYLSEQEIEL